MVTDERLVPLASDVKIPDAILDQAFDLSNAYPNRVKAIAVALLAAEQRGRKAWIEEAAKVALTRSPDDDNLDWQVRQQVAAAIRSLGEKI